VLVVDSVADEFVPLVAKEAAKISYGDPMSLDTGMGTVVNEASAALIEKRVSDAIDQGADLIYGHDRRGALYSPTVLDNVPRDAELVVEETFGPPIPIIRVKDIADAIAVDNGTVFGLSTGICTNRWDYITRFVSELRTGTVNIWEVPGYRIEMSPFGGVKDSGLGYKEGVVEAMKSYTTVKTYSLPW
jgi:acyl-CoA reductase-like NAD-dependent aldehyde dehydrogenase